MERSMSIHEYVIYFQKIKGDEGGARTSVLSFHGFCLFSVQITPAIFF